jgi:hypothetical protein
MKENPMKAARLPDSLTGLLALACAATVVLATALEAEARLGPAGPEQSAQAAPAPSAAAR